MTTENSKIVLYKTSEKYNECYSSQQIVAEKQKINKKGKLSWVR